MVVENSLTLPAGSDELRGPTRDEAIVLRLRLPGILPLTAPVAGEDGEAERTQEQREEDEAEARDIEDEFAEMLNEQGTGFVGVIMWGCVAPEWFKQMPCIFPPSDNC
jgi:hypothetical protein